MISRPIAIAAVAALAACAGTLGVTTHSESYPAYSGSILDYAAGGRDLAVEVRGNPTGASKAEFDAAVVRAMQAWAATPNTRFTTTPGESARRNFRVVLLFDAPVGSNGRAACTPGDGRPQPGGNHVRVQAAFCQRQTPLSEVVGEANGITGPGDPTLSELVGRVTAALLPADAPGVKQGGSKGYIIDRLIFGN